MKLLVLCIVGAIYIFMLSAVIAYTSFWIDDMDGGDRFLEFAFIILSFIVGVSYVAIYVKVALNFNYWKWFFLPPLLFGVLWLTKCYIVFDGDRRKEKDKGDNILTNPITYEDIQSIEDLGYSLGISMFGNSSKYGFSGYLYKVLLGEGREEFKDFPHLLSHWEKLQQATIYAVRLLQSEISIERKKQFFQEFKDSVINTVDELYVEKDNLEKEVTKQIDIINEPNLQKVTELFKLLENIPK